MRNDLLLKRIGAKIKQRRKENKMTLDTLSKASNIDVSNLWFIENGRRNMHILSLKSIADALGLELKDLI